MTLGIVSDFSATFRDPTPLFVVGELITPGIQPYLISNASLVFGPDAMSKSNLVLSLIRAPAVFDEYVVPSVHGKTVLQDRKVHFGKPFQ
jgi:hypothetical protein